MESRPDDGSPDEATSLEMARIAVADAIETTACTPHIYPGLYENDASGIKTRIKALPSRLLEEGIALKLTIGADVHLTPELLGRLKAGTAPSLAGGRYFLHIAERDAVQRRARTLGGSIQLSASLFFLVRMAREADLRV